MPGNDMFAQTHSTPTTMDNDNNTRISYNNIKCDAFPSRFPISHRSPRRIVVVVVVVGTSTKEASRINGTASRDYFNDDHMFARQITSEINAIP